MPKLTEADELRFFEEILTIEEREAIREALDSNSPWSHKNFPKPTKKALKSAKVKIKAFHFERVSKKCCYCRRSLLDATIETDREHIVPKGKVKSLSYDIFNLSLACKRCNMTYKGERTDHILDIDNIETNLRDEDNYLIPHPNIDRYEDHLVRRSRQDGDQEFTTYERLTPKGHFLFDFVQLHRLCVNEFDRAQGGEAVDEAVAKGLNLPVEGA